MPTSQEKSPSEARIPLGMALIVIGVAVVAFAAAAWRLSQNSADGQIPPLLERASVPTEADPGLILLPETPINAPIYPSFASVAEAGQAPPPPQKGQPVRLAIPRIGVDASIVEVGLNQVVINGAALLQWAVPNQYEAGWHGNSSLLGQSGNTVINGHNNTLGEVFRDLSLLESGDIITVDDPDSSFTYVVEQVLKLAEQGQSLETRLANARWIDETSDERITIVSCWPYETNSHRLVVVARPAGQ